MERIEAIISGKVQMVWYRDFATRRAQELGIAGETKNMPDGTVFVIAEGTRENLEAYIEKLKEGPELARVDAVDARWLTATGEYDSFSITQ